MKYTNLDYLTERTRDHTSLLLEMIAAYLEQTPPLVRALKQGVQDKDWDLLRSAAHKMVPSFSIVGIPENFELIARKVQEYATMQQRTDEIPGLVLQLEAVCMQACAELEEASDLIKSKMV